MNYLDHLESVVRGLREVDGIEIERFVISEPTNLDEITNVENNLSFRLPESLRNLYLENAASIHLVWTAEKEVFGSECKRGEIRLLSPNEIYEYYQDMIAIVQEYTLHDTENSEGVEALITDWPGWLPLFIFPNGDSFCLKKEGGEVTFLEHNVMDDGPNLHGLLIAQSFEELMEKWGSIGYVDLYDWYEGVDDSGIDLGKGIYSKLIEKLR